jgi:hypothetical protein
MGLTLRRTTGTGGTSLRKTGNGGTKFLPFTPAALFRLGEPGAWYDPSDLTTLFQDVSGSLPVTGVEQPVRLMLDKSGRGNHLIASADVRRPILSALYNTVEQTENFENVYWTKSAITAITSSVLPPSNTGTIFVNKLIPSTTSDTHNVLRSRSGTWTTSSLQFARIFAKADGYNIVQLRLGTGTCDGVFDLVSGSAFTVGAASASIQSIGDGWYDCSVLGTPAFLPQTIQLRVWETASREAYVGDGVKGILVTGIDVRLANDGVGLPKYQRVTTATNYDIAGFPQYLRFDGIDDCLFTQNEVDFTSTSIVTIVAASRRITGSIVQRLVNIGSDPNNAPGEASILINYITLPSIGFTARGIDTISGSGTLVGRGYVTGAIPLSNVSSLVFRTQATSGDNATIQMRDNGTIAPNQGNIGNYPTTGSLGNKPIFVGAYNNNSQFFNGRLYSLLVRGTNTDIINLQNLETWMNTNTRIY